MEGMPGVMVSSVSSDTSCRENDPDPDVKAMPLVSRKQLSVLGHVSSMTSKASVMVPLRSIVFWYAHVQKTRDGYQVYLGFASHIWPSLCGKTAISYMNIIG